MSVQDGNVVLNGLNKQAACARTQGTVIHPDGRFGGN